MSTQRQEYKLLHQKGRSSRLTRDRIEMLNKVDFIWEAQRGGPKRRRKATVQVPPKASPVDGVGPRAAKRAAFGTMAPQSASVQGFDHQGFPMIFNPIFCAVSTQILQLIVYHVRFSPSQGLEKRILTCLKTVFGFFSNFFHSTTPG